MTYAGISSLVRPDRLFPRCLQFVPLALFLLLLHGLRRFGGGLGSRGPREHHHELPAERTGTGRCGQFAGFASEELFEFLCQFAREHDIGLGICLRQFLEEPLDAMGRFVEDQRSRGGSKGLEAALALTAFVGKKPDEMKLVRRQTAGRQSCDQRTGTRNRFHPETGVEGGADQAFSGVTDARAAGIGHEGDALLLLQVLQHLGDAACFIKSKATQERLADLEMGQQPRRMPCVFGDDHLAFPECAKSAEGDVLEVADRCRDKVQGAGQDGRRRGIAHSELERGGDGGLRCGIDANVVSIQGREPFADDSMREFRPVAITTQMTEIKLAEIGADDFGSKFGGCVVGEMPVPALDSLFDTPRAAPIVLQQLMVVVGFQDQDMSRTDSLDHQFGGMPKICKEPNVAAGGAEQESNRIIGIVGNGERVDEDIADFEGGAGREDAGIQRSLHLAFDGFPGETIAVHGSVQFPAQRGQTLDMIGMFMGDENPMEAFGRATDAGEPFPDLAPAEPGIDQEPGFICLEVGAVPTGTAAKDGEVDRHGSEGMTVG
jgi:hypothetical protein